MSGTQKKILDLGCGNKKRPGAIGVDCYNRTAADVIHDLNVFPYPFQDATFDEIYLDNTLEHLDDVLKVMEEVHRISKPGGLVKVIVPYFRSRWAFVDPTHRHFFTVDSFAYFDPDHIIGKTYPYSLARFKQDKIIFNENIPVCAAMGLIKKLANRWQSRYERFLSHLIPLDDLTYYLLTVK